MISKMIDVAVVVSDAKKAAGWYREKLGFEVGGEPEGHWVVVYPPGWEEGTVIHLCEGPDLEPGNTGVGFATEDLDEAHKEMKDRGVEFTVEPKKEEWGTYAMFKDPDGNEFWLLEE
jgi:catechol 2,3-dioxygenase-like lactoylglutathione lyase family enzyme